LSITLVTAVSAIGAVALHVMGMGAHRAYLSSWGIDSGLFTKSSDWLMYNGYYAFLVEMAGLLSLLTSANWVIAKWLLLLCLSLTIVLSLNAWQPTLNKAQLDRLPAWLQTALRKLIVRKLGQSILLTIFCFCVFVVGVAATVIVLVIPGYFGEKVGKELGLRHHASLQAGCPAGTHKLSCVELWRGDDEIAQGFVIDSSHT